MKKVILDIKNLKKSYEGVISVNDVSFSVSTNNITLITGENGAGKTTLFNLITGIQRATDGNIIFKGKSISELAPLQIARLGVIRMYQQPRLFKNLLVLENLLAAAYDRDKSNFLMSIFDTKKEAKNNSDQVNTAAELLFKFGLEELSNKVAGELSYGQQKLVSFCMLAMNGTKLALLDEPFAGLNCHLIDKLSEIILQMRDSGITFLMIEHNINKALALCDNHLVMNEGKIIETKRKASFV